MKLLAITALFIAGALAVPAGSYPPPPPPDYGGYSPVPSSSGDDYGYVPPTPTPPPPPPPPPPSYDDGGDYEPPTDGDGDSSDGGDDGDDSDDGSDGGDGERSQTNLCPAVISGIAKCCSTNVLDLLNLDCVSPNKEPKDRKDFEKICAGMGRQATCCTLGLLGLGLLCGH
ncbi:hypothetical protein CI102_13948 [Trichoderma harzianum]|nr:hypothetical protein CI102_13948 [Trichoderma harzianum]